MCPSALDNILELFFLLLCSLNQGLKGWKELPHSYLCSSNVHCSGECVVGGLPHVHVIIGVNRLLASSLPAQNLDGTVGYDLVHIHVGLGAASCLPYSQGELISHLSVQDLVAGLHYGILLLFCKLSCIKIGQSRCLLKDSKSPDHIRRYLLCPDLKVFQRPLSLGSPVCTGGNFNLSHGI